MWSRNDDRGARGDDVLAIGVLAIAGMVAAVALVSAAALELGALLEHGRWIDVGSTGLGGVLYPYQHPGAPGGGLRPGARAGAPGAAMWVALMVTLGAAVLAAVFAGLAAFARWDGGHHGRGPERKRDGFLTRAEASRAFSERAARRRAAELRPTLSREELRRRPIDELATPLGTCHGVEVFASHRDVTVILAGMGQGKTTGALAPAWLSWPGPAVFSMTKPADLELLFQPATVERPTVIFNPEGLGGLPTAGYDPVACCADPTMARLMAQAILARQRARGHDRGIDWAFLGEKSLKYLLHAAALEMAEGREPTSGTPRVVEWAAAEDYDAAGVTRALERSPEAPQWAELLRELGRCAPETLYSIKINLHEALACWEDPAVLRRLSQTSEVIDPVDVVRRNARVVVLASGDGHVTPLVTVLVSAIVEAAKEDARRHLTGRGRLEPPLGLFLDEATKVCPLPQLPDLVSDGASQGIVPFIVLQSVDQGERAWGQRWRTIWGAANVHVIMGKISDRETQQAISAMAPEVQVEERRVGRDRYGRRLDPAVRWVPALSTDEISALAPHTAVVFYGRKPMRVEMPRVDSRGSRHRRAALAARAAWHAWLRAHGLATAEEAA